MGFAAQKQYLSFYVVRNRRPEQFDQAVVRSVPDMTAATSGPIR